MRVRGEETGRGEGDGGGSDGRGRGGRESLAKRSVLLVWRGGLPVAKHVLLLKIHVDQTAVGLYHSVLQASVDAKLLLLDCRRK